MPGAAVAATITVNTSVDETNTGDGTCSLREAFETVDEKGNGDCPAPGEANTIVMAGTTYPLTLTAKGNLLLASKTKTLAMTGAGPEATVIDASTLNSRVMDLTATSPAVTISGLTITGGHAHAGEPGPEGVKGGTGAGPGGEGEGAGGIESSASLTLINTRVVGNHAGPGGQGGKGAVGGEFPGAGGGRGGNAGGILNIKSTLTLIESSVSGNFAGNGGNGGFGGSGGATETGGGFGGLGGTPGDGGGILTIQGTVNIINSTISGNFAGSGGDGGHGGIGGPNFNGGHGGGGGDNGGDGGGVYDDGGKLTITASTISGNHAGGGGDGGEGGEGKSIGGNGGEAGAGAFGGGIFTPEGEVSATNSTIAENLAGAGGRGGEGGFGPEGVFGKGGAGGNGQSGGNGGGIARVGPSSGTSLLQVTLARNQAGAGGEAGMGREGVANGAPGAGGAGGGISEAATIAKLQNTIVASNSPVNCSGVFEDLGHNIVFGESGSCPGTPADPKLGPLQANGGPTQTMAPMPGSMAIDKVPASAAGCTPTDQRGVPRPQPAGGLCDVGAVEFALPSCQSLAVATGVGQPVAVPLHCSDPAGAAVTYAIDSSPMHGTLGPLNQATGQVTFTPASGYSGADAFSYHGTSINGSAPAAAVSITVSSTAPGSSGPGGGPGGGLGPGGAHSAQLAIVGAETLRPAAFAAAPSGPTATAAKRRYGTMVTYTLNESASVRFAVLQSQTGRRGRGGRCLKPTKANSHARRCTRYVPLAGEFTLPGAAGANRFHFSGRLSGRKLKPGSYRLQATPSAGGKTGPVTSASFRIIR
jgi:CSLREA domain-containing protein